MECVVLGSGTAIPHPERGSAGYLVRSREGTTLLLDLGLGTLQKLARLGISLLDLDAVALSHLHLDHIGELPGLLFALKNPEMVRTRPLTFYGGPGVRDFFRRLRDLYGEWVCPEVEIRVEEIPYRQVKVGSLLLEGIPVVHSPSSIALRIQEGEGGAVLVYSGDTDVCEGLLVAARDAQVALFECSFPEGKKVPGHLVPSEAARMATEAGVAHLVLTHFYPSCEGVDLVAQCRPWYAGPVTLARDLLPLPVEKPA